VTEHGGPLGPRPTRTELAALAAIAAANVVLNRVVGRRLEMMASLAAAGGLALLAKRGGASLQDQGLSPEAAVSGLRAGAAVAVPLSGLLSLGALVPATRHFYRDPRIVSASAGEAGYQVFARIPVATAAGEEIVFRSAFEGLLSLRRPPWQAALVGASVFGLWHVLPAVDRLHSHPGLLYVHGGSAKRRAGVVIATVVITSVAGLALSWLRRRAGSVLAPIIVHAAVNSAGYACGWLLARVEPEAALASSETPPPHEPEPLRSRGAAPQGAGTPALSD
jgi:membrane protease YdiL (CAAX protease family)